MRTVRQLREEFELKIPTKKDSEYRVCVRKLLLRDMGCLINIFFQQIERPNLKFTTARIPAKLLKQLPFKTRAGQQQKRHKKKTNLLEKRAVILEPEEKKVLDLFTQFKTIRNEKVRKHKESKKERSEQRKLQRQHEEEQRAKAVKRMKKRKYIAAEKKKAGAGGGGGGGKRKKTED